MHSRFFQDRLIQVALLFSIGLILAELLLTIGARYFFECANSEAFFECIAPFSTSSVEPNIPTSLLATLPDMAERTPSAHAEAVHARLTWLASVVLVVFASVAAIVLAVTKVMKERSPMRIWVLWFMGVLVFVCALIAMRSDVSRQLLEDPVLHPTIGSFPVGGIDLATFATIRQIVNALIAGATVALVIALTLRAAFGPAWSHRTGEKIACTERLSDLHHLLIAAAALLVSVILTMVAWLNWPTAGLVEGSEAHKAIVEIAKGVGLYWGVVFTLSLVLVYLPCVGFLRQLRNQAVGSTADGDDVAPTKIVQDAVALLSPFVSSLLPIFLV